MNLQILGYLFPIFIPKRYPRTGDFIQIVSMKKLAHYSGIFGTIQPSKKGILIIDNENARVVIELDKHQIFYKINNTRYKT